MFALLAVAAATLNLTYNDTGKTFGLPTQTTIVVKLAECGDCDSAWRLKSIDPNVVRRVSRRFVAKQHRRVGGPAMVIWQFRTVGAGYSPIELAYTSGRPHSKPTRYFDLKIHVSS
jgi:predicted secreted protein